MNPVNCNNIEDNYLLTNFSSIGNLPKSTNDQYESFKKTNTKTTTTKPPTSTPTNPPDQIEQDNSNDTENNTSWWGATSSGSENTEGAEGTEGTEITEAAGGTQAAGGKPTKKGFLKGIKNAVKKIAKKKPCLLTDSSGTEYESKEEACEEGNICCNCSGFLNKLGCRFSNFSNSIMNYFRWLIIFIIIAYILFVVITTAIQEYVKKLIK